VPGEVARRVHPAARDRLQAGSLLSILAASINLLVMWWVYPATRLPVAAVTACFVLVSSGLGLSARRRWLPDSYVATGGAAVFIGMASVQLASFLTSRTQIFAGFATLLMLAGGAMHTNTRWSIACILYTLLAFLAAGFHMFGRGFALAAGGITIGALCGFVVHLVNMRYLRSIEQLRAHDRRHQAELAAALEAAQRELVDRRRAEEERERLREQLLHSQKLEAIGTLAGGVAHDMNNVLAAIIGLAELMREEEASRDESLDQIVEVARRGTELTRNLLGFSRRGKYRKEPIELSSVVATVTHLLSRTLPKGIELSSSNSATHAVEGDSGQLGQALINLCINSADAMRGTGTLRVDVAESMLTGDAARSLGLADGRHVTVAVTDTGCGMDAETRARMFEPFFTTKEQGRGTGLGLAMVYGTIANHGGAIAVDSEPGRGTSISLHLPAIEAAPVVQAAPQAPVAVHAGGGALVLVVDDEPLVRAVTRRSLERVGYQVITASDGAEAVARFKERAGEVKVVVLDMSMPVMGGAECFRRLREVAPDLPVLLASGYALEQEARECLAAGALGFLEKPYATARLLEVMARARDAGGAAERRAEG
jgi:signal transduction histidine kinase/CheY-like chemotaxis protein